MVEGLSFCAMVKCRVTGSVEEIITMPIFEFKCSKCGEIYDVLFRNREEKVAVTCPKCGSKKAERLLSAFAGKIGNTSAGSTECGSCAATSCSSS